MTLRTALWRTGSPVRSSGYRQAFPSRFLGYFARDYVRPGDRVVHLFSGDSDFGEPVDARYGDNALATGLPDDYADVVLADPPYNATFAAEWGLPYPRPAHILREAARIVRPGGVVAVLHILVLVPPADSGLRRDAIIGVLAGPSNAIRCLNVFRKQ